MTSGWPSDAFLAGSHARCNRPDGHVCQQPSGRTCYEQGCEKPAGTTWGPLWCPEHDADRIDRVSRQMQAITAELDRRTT